MNDEQVKTYTLPNGLRVIHMMSPTQVAYCGIAVDAGSRDERSGEYGLAHFCEHLMFKGTTRRRSWHILNRMESVGGDLNAYTNKEETVFYAAFMRQHLIRATELIADIVFNSTFPQQEIDKECEVIVEEIESFNDSPADLIFDEFENLIYANHSLGHDILGTKDAVRSYKTADSIRFFQRMYKPERMVFFVYGNYSEQEVKRCFRYLTTVQASAGDTRRQVEDFGPRQVGARQEKQMDTHQAHVMMGCRAYPSDDQRRIALYFLNNLIGGPGMNSLLNIALREKRGWVYTVESILTNYTDTSTFSVYFGCEPEHVDKCIRIVHQVLRRLADTPLSERQFGAAMKQIKGQIGVACDNFENFALDITKSFLHYNKVEGVNDTFRHLEQLTPQLLQSVAQDLFTESNLSILIFR